MDLRTIAFVDVFALVELLTIMTVASRAGWQLRLQLPQGKGRSTYLARMHLFDLLPEGVEYDVRPPHIEERAETLVPLMKLDVKEGEHGIEELCNWVYPQLPLLLASPFVEALAEVGTNVIAHSEAEVGFIAAQRYEKDFQGRLAPRVHMVVGDAGIGMRNSLARARPEVREFSDVDAIRLAKAPFVTSKPDVHSGVGLSTVQEYAAMFAGSLLIRSGRGTVTVRRGRERVDNLPALEGTVVSVELCSPGRSRE